MRDSDALVPGLRPRRHRRWDTTSTAYLLSSGPGAWLLADCTVRRTKSRRPEEPDQRGLGGASLTCQRQPRDRVLANPAVQPRTEIRARVWQDNGHQTTPIRRVG